MSHASCPVMADMRIFSAFKRANCDKLPCFMSIKPEAPLISIDALSLVLSRPDIRLESVFGAKAPDHYARREKEITNLLPPDLRPSLRARRLNFYRGSRRTDRFCLVQHSKASWEATQFCSIIHAPFYSRPALNLSLAY